MPTTTPLTRDWPAHAKRGLLNATALARVALLGVLVGFDDGALRARDAARLELEVAALKEELRIKDARLEGIPPRERPHCPAKERLAILLLKAAMGWSVAQAARRFEVTPMTIGNWQRRLDEEGRNELVQTRTPVNRFPDFVAALVQQLERTVPAMGTRRIAATLGRAGLHVAKTTVERLAGRKVPVLPTPPAAPTTKEKGKAPVSSATGRIVTARYPHHLWHVDITVVPTLGGFWTPWWPFTVPTCWPFCWHVVMVVDHFSRAPVARGVFKQEPTAAEVCAVPDEGAARAGREPTHIVSDQGSQFTSETYDAWCTRRGAKPRFGALGKHGSIAVIERFFRSLKQEGQRRIAVPFGLAAMNAELDSYLLWYTVHRPHTSLGGATPAEVLAGKVPANRRVAMEVRGKYPLRSPRPGGVPRRRVRKRLELQVDLVDGHRHLPVVALRLAA